MVRPRNACGQFVTRFIKGYVPTITSEDAPSARVKSSNWSRTPRPAASCAPRNALAASGDTAPHAIGRVRVRATFLSISRSIRSFTVQPAPRSSTLPIAKSARCPKSGAAPASAASAADQKHGHISRCAPMGLSSRASFAKGTASSGNARSTHVSRAPSHTGGRAGFPSAARPRSSNVRRAGDAPRVARRRTVGRWSAPTGDAAANDAFSRGGACAPDSVSLDTDAQCVCAARPWTTRQPCDAGARDANAEADGSST